MRLRSGATWLLVGRFAGIVCLLGAAVVLAVAGRAFPALVAVGLAVIEAMRLRRQWSRRTVEPAGDSWWWFNPRVVALGLVFVGAAMLLEFWAGLPRPLVSVILIGGFLVCAWAYGRTRPANLMDQNRSELDFGDHHNDECAPPEGLTGEHVRTFEFTVSGRAARILTRPLEWLLRRFERPPPDR
jgi:hypothetical protein